MADIKRHRVAQYIVGIALSFLTTQAMADTASSLSRFVGYTIAGSFTITGWQDGNGKRGDSFEGCEFDRVIILDDSKTLRCATYSYSYSYRPTAVVLVKGASFKMIVGNDIYDMNR